MSGPAVPTQAVEFMSCYCKLRILKHVVQLISSDSAIRVASGSKVLHQLLKRSSNRPATQATVIAIIDGNNCSNNKKHSNNHSCDVIVMMLVAAAAVVAAVVVTRRRR